MGPGPLVEREDDSPALPRAVRERGGSAGGDHAGSGSLARGVRPGEAVQDRHAPALVGHRGGRRQDGARRRADGGGPDQQERRGQRAATRAPDRRLRVQARRRAAQGGEARGRRPDRRPRGRLPLQRMSGLHARLRGEQGRQHDHGVPRHHDHDDQVQPVHLPTVRLRAGPGSRRGAVPGEQDWQAVAHRLCRLRVGTVHARRLRRADQGRGRLGRRDDGHPARHGRHDAVPVEGHWDPSTGCSGSSSGPRGSPS